jgi:hypothetical protein
MKKLTVFFVILFCFAAQVFSQNVVLVNYQTPGNYYYPNVGTLKTGYSPASYHETPVNLFANDDKPISFGVYVNPVGFLMFGPIVGTELIINSKFIIDAHFRYPLGLMSYIVATDDEEGWPNKVTGFGIGGGFKYLFNGKIGGLYTGLLLEYGVHKYTYAEGEDWVWTSEWPAVIIMAPVGYRFKFNSGFFINTGAIVGAALPINPTWYYLENYNDDSSIHSDDASAKPYGMIEVSFGFKF